MSKPRLLKFDHFTLSLKSLHCLTAGNELMSVNFLLTVGSQHSPAQIKRDQSNLNTFFLSYLTCPTISTKSPTNSRRFSKSAFRLKTSPPFFQPSHTVEELATFKCLVCLLFEHDRHSTLLSLVITPIGPIVNPEMLTTLKFYFRNVIFKLTHL